MKRIKVDFHDDTYEKIERHMVNKDESIGCTIKELLDLGLKTEMVEREGL